MFKFWRILVFLCLISLPGACTSARSPSPFPPTGRLDQIRQTGQLRVATAITRPFEYRDPATNALIGFDVDLMTRLVEPLGITLEWREMAFVDLLPELQSGNVDVVVAAMYIRPDRETIVDFSQPYLKSGLVLVVQKDNKTIRSLADLAGHTVGVKEGSTGEQKAEQLQQDQGIDLQIHRYTDTDDSLHDLANGRLDAVFNDVLNTLVYIQTHPELRILPAVLEPAGLGIAVHTGDTELLDFINQRLVQFEADQTLADLFNQWINPETAHVVP